MATRKSSTSRMNNKLVMVSAAFQDHITQNLLLDHNVSMCSRTANHPRDGGRVAENRLHDEQEEREYVLDPPSPRLTLAQKMGLVAPPSRRLTEEEWIRVKLRSTQEGDSAQPCVICREEFRLQPQVLLCCSHVFHRECLEAFERFSGRNFCPMCRKEQYETRLIHDAAQLFRHHCATRIQACWRGHVARRWYRDVRKTLSPTDTRLRRRFFEAKLQELSDSFVRYCHTDVEAFLSDIDRSLSSSRAVFQQLERNGVSEPQESDWDRIQSQVMQRDVWDCPICLTALSSPGPGPGAGRRTVSPGPGPGAGRHTVSPGPGPGAGRRTGSPGPGPGAGRHTVSPGPGPGAGRSTGSPGPGPGAGRHTVSPGPGPGAGRRAVSPGPGPGAGRRAVSPGPGPGAGRRAVSPGPGPGAGRRAVSPGPGPGAGRRAVSPGPGPGAGRRTVSPDPGPGAGRRSILLSCSHLFHQWCLEAFESFCVDSRPSCPLCRSAYYKRLF